MLLQTLLILQKNAVVLLAWPEARFFKATLTSKMSHADQRMSVLLFS